MSEGFFEDIERRVLAGEELEDILEEIIAKLDDDEFRKEVEDDITSYFQSVAENPQQIFEFEGKVQDLYDRSLQELGSSFEEFEDYMERAVEENEDVAEILETHLMAWHNLLIWIQLLENEPDSEYSQPIHDVFSDAISRDPEKVNQVLCEQVEGFKLIYGFQKALSKTGTRGKPSKKILTDKIEVVEELYESIFYPISVVIAQLISTKLNYSTDLNSGSVKNRFETSSEDESKFWDDDARHIRNASAHNTFILLGNSVLIIDEEWRKEFSEEEIEDKISKLVDDSKNMLYSLSDAYVKHFPHEEYYPITEF